MKRVVVHASAKTDVGRVRERNEDSYLLDHDHMLYVVADGMGGHAGGQRASQLAVATLHAYVQQGAQSVGQMAPPGADEASPPVAQFLADGVRHACATIFDEAEQNHALLGMGTTTTALMLRHGWAYIAHVGDSRCYMQREGRLAQLTEDHSLVNEQVRAGLITREMAQKSRMKNIITRSVGFERDVDVDTFLLPVQVGDHFLLCSDGLSNLIEEHELAEAMSEQQDQDLVGALVQQALERGGDDNVTIVAVRVAAAPHGPFSQIPGAGDAASVSAPIATEASDGPRDGLDGGPNAVAVAALTAAAAGVDIGGAAAIHQPHSARPTPPASPPPPRSSGGEEGTT